MRNLSGATLIVVVGWLGATQKCVAATLSVDAPSSVAVGDTFTVNVNIASITDLYGFQFDLSFDPTILAADSSIEGPFLPSGGATFFIPGAIDNIGGAVAFTADTLLTAISGVTGDGNLASFSFDAIGTGTSALTLANVFLVDSSNNPIDVDLNSGSVTVAGVSTVPEPSSALLLALVVAIALGKRRPIKTHSA